MNYSQKGLEKKRHAVTSVAASAKKKTGVTALKIILISLLCIVVIGVCAGLGAIQGILKSTPSISTMDVSPTGYSTTVYDADGNVTASLVSAGANRVYVTIDEIPEDLQHAFIAIEDERFYEHNGIDYRGIGRALYLFFRSGGDSTQGASTITQQLLKNNVFTNWTSESGLLEKLKRKIQEQYLALQLEKVVSKEWILENYLNTINLGQNTLGVQAASERYFNKDVSELTLSESAVIAGITQNPTKYNPVSNPENNADRRKLVLSNMLEQGYITQSEYDEAMADNVYDRIQTVNSETASSSIYSYFVDELIEQVIDDLMEVKGYSESQAYKLLYSGGLSIYTTQDSAIQQICDEEAANDENYPSSVKTSFNLALTIQTADGEVYNYDDNSMLAYMQKYISKNYTLVYDDEDEALEAITEYENDIMEEGDEIIAESIQYTKQPQASIVVMDQSNGEVKAIVGGRGTKVASLTLNRATNTYRQPGSTFKILSTYSPALDVGGFTLASVQDDAPYTYADGTPLNNYDKSFGGFTTIRQGITTSINIVAVKTLTAITPQLGYEYLQDYGFTSLSSDDIVQALALGGISKGVSNLENTAAYAAIANDGVYIEPTFYTKILDHDGNVLIDNTPATHRVIKETTAWLLTSAMQDVVTKGTAGSANFGTTPIAGKTGTTQNAVDSWFVGFTNYYTCGVWGGEDHNAPLSDANYTKWLWKAVMSRIHEGFASSAFTQPSGIVTATVCKKSGKLAIAGVCDADPRGSMVYTEYFAEGTEPTEYCDHHMRATVCLESGMIAGAGCTNTQSSVFIIGGSAGTDDEAYLLTDEAATTVCTLHNEPGSAPTSTTTAATAAAAAAAAAQQAAEGTTSATDATTPATDATATP